MRFYDDEDIDDEEKDKEAEARQQMEDEEEEYNESRRTERVTVEEPDDEEEEQQENQNRKKRKKKKDDDNSKGKNVDKEKTDSKKPEETKNSDNNSQNRFRRKNDSSADPTKRKQKKGSKTDKTKSNTSGDAAKTGAQKGTQQGAQSASSAANASTANGARSAASGAAKGAASGGSAAGGGTAAGGGSMFAGLGTAIIIILIIIVVLGLLFFFITMPGLVVGKINAAINKFTDGIKNFLDGKGVERSVTRGEIVKAANYLESMGYDLQGYGFLDEEGKATVSGVAKDGFADKLHTFFLDNGSGKNAISPTQINISDFDKQNYKERYEEAVKNGDDNAKNIKEVTLAKDIYEYDATGAPIPDAISDLTSDSDVRSNMLMIKNLDGEVEFIKSKYLYMYIMAANNSYFVKNDNLDLASRIKTLYDNSGLQEEEGAGMLYFTDDNGTLIKNYIEGWPGDSKYGYSNTFADPEILRNN